MRVWGCWHCRWFITATAISGILLAAGVQASINLYVPGGGIRFFAVARTVARYAERVYNHDTVLRLLTDIRVALFERLSTAGRDRRTRLRGPQWLSRLTNDVDALDTLYLRLIAPTALAALVTAILLISAWLMYRGELAVGLALVLVPAFLVATLLVYLRTRHLVYQQTAARERVRTDVIEHIEASGNSPPQDALANMPPCACARRDRSPATKPALTRATAGTSGYPRSW